jgi:hypothetical protein
MTIASVVGAGILIWLLIATLSWLQKTLQGFSAPDLKGTTANDRAIKTSHSYS